MDSPTNSPAKGLYEMPLYTLLRDQLPSEYVVSGRINTEKLSDAIGVAQFTVYRWIHSNKLTPKAVRSLLDVSNGAQRAEEKGLLTRSKLYPFLPI